MADLTEEAERRSEEDDEHGSKEKVLQKYFLQEWDLVKSLLDDIVSQGRVSDPSIAHKIRSIMDKYQEQGQLIEPYLETIVSPLMFIIRSKTVELGVSSGKIIRLIKPMCIIIYSLVTVCGYKAVIRFFPHQVSDLELAVSLLEMCHHTSEATSQRHESTGEMETKCVLLLWLSILVLVPFDISTIDTSIASDSDLGEHEPAPLVLKIIGISKGYLSTAGPMRTIAALLISKLLTRPDMATAFSSLVGWTHEVLSSSSDDVVNHFRLLGAVEALTAIFKGGGRKLLVDVVPKVWEDSSFLIKSGMAAQSTLLRKYLMKLTQRIGFTCLPHHLAPWRYVSKSSILGENMSSFRETDKISNCANVDGCNSEKTPSFLEDEDMDVPEIVEEIIEMLLTGLRDTDTVVRWSSAKGIGRITSRLTSALSEEVLSSVLELFSHGEGDGSWHGGCLALAELARRGLLLPISLQRVVPVVVKALHYDIRRGPHSVGSHVRDAAAYVCWAFGRAYYHSDMRNVLDQLAPHLLTVACYDREVNCRRAAAAAFQENVGRQGNYPHGIDIVNTADYFSLSSRTNSYMHVGVVIAQYEGYLYLFAEELVFNKICHWEKGLRETASGALAALVKYDPAYFADFIWEKLVPCTLSPDLCTRHGATLALGELVLALHHCDFDVSSDKKKCIAGVVPAIEKARLYRGKGGEIMRLAVSRFIECMSSVCTPLTEKIKRSLLDTLNENLRHPNPQIQDSAAKALKQFVEAYVVTPGTGGARDILSKYLELLTDQNVAVRRGMALAIAVLPQALLAKRWKDVLTKLSTCCAIEDNPDHRDAEARVNAVKGLVSVCEILMQETRVDVDHKDLTLLIKNEVVIRLLTALDDYSIDNRGDVGSWVREAAMDGLRQCTYILCKKDSVQNNEFSSLFDENMATSLVGGICKQAVEKMDKLREAAVKALQMILYCNNRLVPNIPHRKELEKNVPEKSDLRWAVPSFSFPRFVQLLQFSCYSRSVLSGLVISIGGLQESLRKVSLLALLEYLQAVKAENQDKKNSREYTLSTDMLWVLQQYRRCDRVIIPTLRTIEMLFSNKIFLNMEAHTVEFCAGVLDSLTVELKVSKDFSKLYAGISILGYIASSSDSKISTRSFSHLLSFLGHRYPKIRKASAEQVYLVLLQNSNLVDENKIDKALEIVSETCWDAEIETLRPQRLELYDMAGLEANFLKKTIGVSKKMNETKTPTMAMDENASYSSLVDSSGF